MAADTSRSSYGADRCSEIVAGEAIAGGAPKASERAQPLQRMVYRSKDDDRWINVTVLVDIHRYRDRVNPRWTAENRQFVDRAKPAISGAAETSEFYFVPSSVRKSVCTFVRQLRGPHFSTWA